MITSAVLKAGYVTLGFFYDLTVNERCLFTRRFRALRWNHY